MPPTPEHLSWLIDTQEVLLTQDGKQVKVLEFRHEADEEILSSWAKHFRNHYCNDDHIDTYRSGTGFTREEYLKNIKFPDRSTAPGPSIRSGDFAEILLADYIEFALNFWVPRTRYSEKAVRNESTKGVDIIGFKIISSSDNIQDTLITYEAKAKLSGTVAENRLQDAIDSSVLDEIRKSESLNAIKVRLLREQKLDEAKKVERFQDRTDRPYKQIYGAAAVLSVSCYDADLVATCQTTNHPGQQNIHLLIIKGDRLMELAHALYERAANEA